MRKHNTLILSILCFLFLICYTNIASADEGGIAIFETLAEKTGGFAQGFRKLAMVLGAFGIIMFTFMAICGKINFKHLGYIVICLFFLAGTASLISYISDNPELPTTFGTNTDTHLRNSNI